jgi:hypothetical protein
MIPVNNWPTDNEILNCSKYSSKIINDNLFIFDARTNVVSVFCLATKPDNIIVKNSGGTARWKSRLKPGETKVIKFLMAFGDNQQTLSTKIKDWGNHFDSTFAKIENGRRFSHPTTLLFQVVSLFWKLKIRWRNGYITWGL